MQKAKIKSYKDLVIWQRSIALVKNIYSITKQFPKEEIYELTSQMRRAAVSIPSSIAEGFGRFGNNDYRQFLYISLGSGAELVTQLIISEQLTYLTNKKAANLIDETEQISRMITSLIKNINNNS